MRKPRMGLARISVVRGAGPRAGTPAIDDYIRSLEAITDHLTKFSGLVRRCSANHGTVCCSSLGPAFGGQRAHLAALATRIGSSGASVHLRFNGSCIGPSKVPRSCHAADPSPRHVVKVPGDLDPQQSPHHLTTMKKAYLKLRFLVDAGCTLVGHDLRNDFRLLNIVVPVNQVGLLGPRQAAPGLQVLIASAACLMLCALLSTSLVSSRLLLRKRLLSSAA